MEQPDDQQMTKNKRRRVPHTILSAATLLNALTKEDSLEIIQNQINDGNARITEDGCILSRLKCRQGDYPRIKIPVKYKPRYSPEIQKMFETNSGATKVMLHQIAWRSRGELVPDYDDGIDLSHTCRRGQVRFEGAKNESRNADTCNAGCFNKDCLELSSHKDNLLRSNCVSIQKCSYCQLYTNHCIHHPSCGSKDQISRSNLTTQEQKKIVKIVIIYEDGSSNEIIPK